ncbi:selenocysteine-specific elongation factor [Phlebotomus argentipes]|uniref:selenocysteine-specific elongation factor n=1 Tax=Phlebotomus argentipes TaxID=94469 RepID=UPI0028933C1A|nr:selenocysteine-specific elongation factor [Phlebotomus argentipes]
MPINLNIGILGHVDSGKTTLAKALSAIASTGAFDKSPQSQERGITLDLGFSALQVDLPSHLESPNVDDKLQYTFVDCPGHASLIRTIISGAQIIDFMILVLDAVKGIQTQTAECIVIGQLTCKKMLVVLNKIDLLEDKKHQVIEKMTKRMKITLESLNILGSPVVPVSATTGENLQLLLDTIKSFSFIPSRRTDKPFLFAVDHCFSIRGQGTICTGTVLQGSVRVSDEVEVAQLKLSRKVKSIQMFKEPLQEAKQGDRIGISITQFDSKALERGFICKSGSIIQCRCGIIKLSRISFYRSGIASSQKFHITAGHETVLASVVLFSGKISSFSFDHEYKFLEEMPVEDAQSLPENVFVLLQFERPIPVIPEMLVIASKLDLDVATTSCRLAFFGNLLEVTEDKDFTTNFLPRLKIFKEKTKRGTIQRLINDSEAIAANLLKPGSREVFLGMEIQLATGEVGTIESTFGQTSKVKLRFKAPLKSSTIESIKSKSGPIAVELRFKKFIYDRQRRILQ